MGHDCCRPPQLRFVGLQYLFSLIPKVTLLTQLHLGLLHFRPALRGFEFRSLTLAKFPHHPPFNFRFIAQRNSGSYKKTLTEPIGKNTKNCHFFERSPQKHPYK